MDIRLTFDENEINYDRYRPTYCPELFEAVIDSMPNGAKHAVEVGCGTGQATAPFLAAGYNVDAVELGERLAAYAAKKFQDFPGFRVHNLPFEKFCAPAESVDLLYSATAFHWIPEEIGYPKAFELLKPGGTIALFWNRPFVSRPEDPLHMELQTIYEGYFSRSKAQEESQQEVFRVRENTLLRYGFVHPECRLFHRTRQFSAEDYVGLLLTYSDHRSMPGPKRTAFLDQIRHAIHAHGGILTVYDTMDLHIAQKPASL